MFHSSWQDLWAETKQRNLNQMEVKEEASSNGRLPAGLEASLTASCPTGGSQRTPAGAHTCLRETGFVEKEWGRGEDQTSNSLRVRTSFTTEMISFPRG